MSEGTPSGYMPDTALCEKCEKNRVQFKVRFDERRDMHADYGACACGAEAYTKSYRGTRIV